MRGAHADGPHSGGSRPLHANDRVLEHEAALGRDAEAAGGQQVDLRIGLAPPHVLGGDDDLESIAQTALGQERLDVVAGGRCGDRSRHAPRGELGDELRDAANQGGPSAGEAAVVLLLARGQTLRLRPRRLAAEEQRNGLEARPADRQAPVVGLGGHDAELVEQRAPGRSMMGPGVDQHAVHVEDDGEGLHAYRSRYRGASARKVSSAAERYCASVQRAASSAGTARPTTNWPSRVRVSSSASSPSFSGVRSARGAAGSSSCSFLNQARCFTRRRTGPTLGAFFFHAVAQRRLSACSGPISNRKRTVLLETAILKWLCFL